MAHDWDSVLATFPHPRYEIIPTQTVHAGEAAVRGYYRDTRVAFPDQRHEMIALRHADDAVIVEFYLLGTHRGPLGPVPPTGARFKVRMTAFFVFDGEELICERIYFDQLTLRAPITEWNRREVTEGNCPAGGHAARAGENVPGAPDDVPDGREPTVASAETVRG